MKNRATSRRLLDLLHVGNRFKLMFGHPLNPADPDVILMRQEMAKLTPGAHATNGDADQRPQQEADQ